MPRQFTVEEANALLPTLAPMLEELRDVAKRLIEVRDELATISPAGRLNGMAQRVLQLEVEAAASAALADGLLQQLSDAGVEVKDPLTGLIDFRSWRGRQEVYLCWRLGEGPIAWWHALDAGIQGRRPL
ncbi:MAG TPA: DUF2203 domain-containing protein [Chloroflexota bacterium]|jgi:hypothetical protein|nr:DUF2203 domain-containing protein [Chloroflexota bacterium]